MRIAARLSESRSHLLVDKIGATCFCFCAGVIRVAVAQGIGACLEERVDGVLMNTSELGGRLSPAIYFEILAFAFAARSREGLKEREEGRKGVELERIVAAIVEKISHDKY